MSFEEMIEKVNASMNGDDCCCDDCCCDDCHSCESDCSCKEEEGRSVEHEEPEAKRAKQE
mgnify:CR=1 FL=1